MVREVIMKGILKGMILTILLISTEYGEVRGVNTSDHRIEFELSVKDFSHSTLSYKNQRYSTLQIPGFGMIDEIGVPSLPVKYIYCAVPLGARDIRIQIEKGRKRKIQNIRITPGFLMRWNGIEIEENRGIYNTNSDFPGKDFEIEFDGILFHQRILRVAIYPFQFNPVEERLVFHETMNVSVEYDDSRYPKGEYRNLGIPTERRLEELLLNYSDSKSWREKEKTERETLLNYEPWFKLIVSEDGLYKVDYEFLQNNSVDPSLIDPRTIKVYNGGSAVQISSLSNVPSEDDTIPYQVPVYVHGEEDGSFDNDDYVMFYGISLTGWERSSPSSEVPLFYNPYTDENVYWITWGGLEGSRMAIIDGNPQYTEPHKPSCYAETLHIEENYLCPAKSGFGWVWEEVILPRNVSSISRNYTFSVENLYSDSFELFTALYGATTGVHSVEVLMNGIPICDTSWSAINYTSPYTFACGGSNLTSGENTLTLRIHKSGGGDDIYIDYFEVSYYKNYRAVNNDITFQIKENSPVDTIYEFDVYGFSESPFIVDVSSPFAPSRVTGGQFNAGTVTFQLYVPQDERVKCVASKLLRTPSKMIEANPFSLRLRERVDCIIITHKKLYYAASCLKQWREEHLLGVPNPSVKLVTIDEVYDNFSWGLHDPVAIRNFVYYAANYWEYPPGYFVLFGGGSYDYKNLFGNSEPKNLIPPFETGDYVHFQELMSHNPCFEDFFTDLDGDMICDIPIGRITVVTEEEAGDVVEKIKRYESSNNGVWKNKVILLADDEFDYNGIDGLYRYHIPGCEDISRVIPAPFDRRKVYLTEFSGTNPGSVPPGSKPHARDSLITTVSEGALLGIFLGHGNLRQLTHELVFYRADVNMLENDFRDPFFYFGSCSVGDFDRPDEESIADLLQKKERRGAISTLACTRTSGYTSITTLGIRLARRMLENKKITLGDGVCISKNDILFGSTYALFGDPATPLFSDSVGFQASISSETLSGGMRVSISGQTDIPGFDGYVFISGFDPVRSRQHHVPVYNDTLPYKLPGNSVFKGVFDVIDGEFNAYFFVPTKLDTGSTGKVSMYVWNEDREGRGCFDSLVTGIDDTVDIDTIPPSIEIYYKGDIITDGMEIPSNAEIVGVLQDESGIDITGRENRGIYLAIDEDYVNTVKLNSLFAYDLNSYTKGSFSYTLDLEPSATSVKLEFTCFDNRENQALKILNVDVFNGETFTLKDVYNIPNPLSEVTYFTFHLSHRSSVSLSIFTMTGKEIYRTETICKSGFNRVKWDGRDSDGDRIANGIYFFLLHAKPTGGSVSPAGSDGVEFRGKIAIAR
jgi:hypothetical protein